MTSPSQAAAAMHYLEFSLHRCDPQDSCPLFTTIPAEIRDHIFAYALQDYEDISTLYEENTCYRRPNYFAPRRSDTALLRTCQRIYRETWFRPWTAAEQSFYLTTPDRRPAHVTTVEKIQPHLDLLHDIHAGEVIELDHVRVFPQLYLFEDGRNLQQILDLRHFYPRTITVTLRHTDWWHWEVDRELHIRADWVRDCQFPASLREFRIELESLERKRDQIDDMAQQMAEDWMLRRRDGVVMTADASATPIIMRWSGSSSWGGHRWVRDETNTPGMLEYYVRTVVWRPEKSTAGISICDSDILHVVGPTPQNLRVRNAARSIVAPNASIHTRVLEGMGIPSSTPAAETLKLFVERQRRRAEEVRQAALDRQANLLHQQRDGTTPPNSSRVRPHRLRQGRRANNNAATNTDQQGSENTDQQSNESTDMS